MTAILWGALTIILPIYIGWRVWKRLDRGFNPDTEEGADTVKSLIKKVLISTAAIFISMLIMFKLVEFLMTP